MTEPRIFSRSLAYATNVDGLLRLHQLSLSHQDESEETDKVRESMCQPWESLSKVEKQRLTGLSQDLYAISDGTHSAAEPMNPQAHAKLAEAYEARAHGLWDKALELLRRWGKHLPPALASYLRGTIWRDAGEARTAAVFFEHALSLEPHNDNYEAVFLHTLKTADPGAAKLRADKVLKSSEANSPAVVAYAAEIVFSSTRNMQDAEAHPIYKELIPVLERTLARVESRPDVDATALLEMLVSLLATAYRILGDTRRAYSYYSRAIQLDPTNDALLIARGILLYGADPNAASDFEQALRLRSALIWPYFFLAHNYLAKNRFEECITICEQALQTDATARVQSELWEFRAISLAALSYPEHAVRRAFENAIRIDPSNDRARRNMEAYRRALENRSPQTDWERMSDASMRKFGEREIQFVPSDVEEPWLTPA